eukprot:Awhi_evm1s8445
MTSLSNQLKSLTILECNSKEESEPPADFSDDSIVNSPDASDESVSELCSDGDNNVDVDDSHSIVENEGEGQGKNGDEDGEEMKHCFGNHESNLQVLMIDPRYLSTMKNLETLVFEYSHESTFPSLRHLHQLKTLSLFCSFYFKDFTSVGCLNSLCSLHLSHCIQLDDLEFVKKLPHLKYFDVRDCGNIVDITPLETL